MTLPKAPIDVRWNAESRHFIVRSDAMQTLHRIQRLPGARLSYKTGGIAVPEIAVVDLSKLLGGLVPSYRDHMACAATLPDTSRIPTVSPGGRILRVDQVEDAARLYGRCWALWNAPGTGKTTCAAAAIWAMLRDGLTPGLVWVLPLQTQPQIAEELRRWWGLESAPADKWDGQPVMLVNWEKVNPRWGYTADVDQILSKGGVLLGDEIQRAGHVNVYSDQLMRWRWLAKIRWAMSGTPVQNRIATMHRPYKFVTGADVTEGDWHKKFVCESDGRPRAGTAEQLGLITQTWSSIRGKTVDVPYTEVMRWVSLEGRQQELYKQAAKQAQAEIRGANSETWKLWVKNPFLRLLRCLQVARDPRLLKEELKDNQVAKVQGLKDLLDELEGHKVVVWSGHPSICDRVVAQHGGVAYHGEISQTQRQKNRKQFMEDPDCRIFCANPTVAGTGLDGLQEAANYAIVLDLPNAAPDWRQLVDRLHRLGQHRAVTVYVLLAQNTVEEWQWRRLMLKQREASILIGQAVEGPEVTQDELLKALAA